MDKRTVEHALARIKVNASKGEIYPESGRSILDLIPPEPAPPKPTSFFGYIRRAFQHNSDLVMMSHMLKSVFGPTILAMPHAFSHGGLAFSSAALFVTLLIITYNMGRLIKSADYLTQREKLEVKTYDEVAFVSFRTCSDKTKGYARTFKLVINLMFVITRLDACCIFIIFCARNVEALTLHYFPGHPFSIWHIIFFEVLLLMLMNSIRQLKYLSPFSLFSTILLSASIIIALVFFICIDLPDPIERKQIGNIGEFLRFNSIVLFSQSGIAVALTMKSSMENPTHFLSCPGVFPCTMTFIFIIYLCFGFLGFLKFGNETAASVMLNLPVESGLSLAVKLLTIASVISGIPIVFYITFNVLWNNYLKHRVNEANLFLAEYFVRYSLTLTVFVIAAALPNLGPMIVLKGAVLHSQLEVIYPAILDFVTFYPEEGHGRLNCRLIKLILLMCYGLLSFIGGTIIGVSDMIDQYKQNLHL